MKARGKSYRHRIIKGPYSGRECRILKQDDDRHYLLVKIRGEAIPFALPLEWIAPRSANHPRRKKVR